MKMTKVDALNIALSTLTADSYDVKYDAIFADGTPTIHTETYTQQEVQEVIKKMIAQLSKPRKRSEKAKIAANERRKAATASARAALVDKIAPILREGLSHTQQGVTVKELFALVEDKLPDGFTPAQVQNILIREMAPELDKIERKGKSNLYRLAEADDPNQYLHDEVAV